MGVETKQKKQKNENMAHHALAKTLITLTELKDAQKTQKEELLALLQEKNERGEEPTVEVLPYVFTLEHKTPEARRPSINMKLLKSSVGKWNTRHRNEPVSESFPDYVEKEAKAVKAKKAKKEDGPSAFVKIKHKKE